MNDRMKIEALKRELVVDEGMVLTAYKDTEGYVSIGVGRQLDTRGISEGEAMVLLDNDIKIVIRELDANKGFWRELSEDRQRALANMAFNMGMPRLMKFKKMWIAIERGDFKEAAAEMLNSKWAEQVGQRAHRLSVMMREG